MTITATNVSKTFALLDDGTIASKQRHKEYRGDYPIDEPTYTGDIDRILVLDKNWVIVSWNPHPSIYTYIDAPEQSNGLLTTYWDTLKAAYSQRDPDNQAYTTQALKDDLIEDYMVAARKAIGEESIGTTAYWAISSSDDTNYSTPQAPTSANKIYYDFTDSSDENGEAVTAWQYVSARGLFNKTYRIYTYIEMPTSMVDGKTYTITMDSGDTVTFLFDDLYTVSRAIKVNQVGYLDTATEKYAYLGGYLHSDGPLDLSHATSFSVINADTGATALTGTPRLMQANPCYQDKVGSHTGTSSATVLTDSAAALTIDAHIGQVVYNYTDGSKGTITDNDGTTVTVSALSGGTNNTWETGDRYAIGSDTDSMYGEDVYRMDISALTGSGTFFISVPGVGRSWPFLHGDNAYTQAGYTALRGIMHQRAGQPKLKTHTQWCRNKALMAPYYESEFVPTPLHGAANAATSAESSFTSLISNVFDIVGYTIDYDNSTAEVAGGWHDAADWDCRMYHYLPLFDLLYAYQFNSTNFADSQLNTPSSGDGLPDILSEAKHGLDIWKASQDGVTGGVAGYLETWTHTSISGYTSGVTTIHNKNIAHYAFSQRTTYDSALYAAAAAMFARLVAPFNASISSTYQTSAIAAYDFANASGNSLGAATINAAVGRAIPDDSGTDDASSAHATVMTDSGESWSTDQWVGFEIYNRTDGSKGTITGNTSNTITCSGGLSGGTLNVWNSGDSWAICEPYSISWAQDYTTDTDPYLMWAKCQLYMLTGTSSYITDAPSVSTIDARYTTEPGEFPGVFPWLRYSIVEAYDAGATSISSEAAAWSTWFTDKADWILTNLKDKPYTAPKIRYDGPLNRDMQESLAWGSSCMPNYSRFLEIAYDITGLAKYRQGTIHTLDWHFGCNPMGMSWTTGIGYVYPVCILHGPSQQSEWKDPVPGISPYGITGANKYYTIRENIWRCPFDSTGSSVVSTLTQAAGTATLVSTVNHGLSTGDYVFIQGANETEYNGSFQITVTNDTTFTFAVDSGAASPATGSLEVFVEWLDGTAQTNDPIWRIYSNDTTAVGQTEFTIQETMGGVAFATAVLIKNETIEDKQPRDPVDLHGQWHFM